jgi:hypothetical protein
MKSLSMEIYDHDSRLKHSKWTETGDQANNATGKEIVKIEVPVEERSEQNPDSRDLQLHAPYQSPTSSRDPEKYK